MKIAVVSEDGKTISQHFGRAPLYVVATMEDGKITHKETREKAGHHTFAAEERPGRVGGGPGKGGGHSGAGGVEPHGYGAGSLSRHARMAQTIDDCQVLIAGGMGWGAYDNLKSRGIEAVITDVNNIDEAIRLYIEGKLPNLMDRLH
jgi:predicted Fe-Mo cluster-binding NifX family protein